MASSQPLRASDARLPAEWELHAATWLAWPHARDDFPGKLSAVRWAFTEIIRHLSVGERVRLLVAPGQQTGVVRHLRHAGVDVERVDLIEQLTDRSWTRDYLPLFVVPRRGRRSVLGAVKFRFNAWARYSNFHADDRAGDQIAKRVASAVWQPRYRQGRRQVRAVLEGGALDVDGAGSLLTTERCLLGSPFQRNPGLERSDTERLLGEYLGVRRVIWLEDGIAGDDTSGHVDDFARFVAPARVVVAEETNARDDNHRPLADAARRLARARDASGKKLEVVPIPMPSPVRYRGERLPASYANFYIGNEAVLVPTFNDPADRVALKILAELFPTRRVVGIHATELVVGLGTLHCSTMQEPALEA